MVPPGMVTVWYHDPSGYDDTTCHGKRWQLHVHHWRIQVLPLQQLRRRLLTRCTWCGGRSVKGDQANLSHQWDRARGHWWEGERGLFHRDCSSIKIAHATCVCEQPVLDHDNYGRCARCDRTRSFGMTAENLARARELAAIPHGKRRSDQLPTTSSAPRGKAATPWSSNSGTATCGATASAASPSATSRRTSRWTASPGRGSGTS